MNINQQHFIGKAKITNQFQFLTQQSPAVQTIIRHDTSHDFIKFDWYAVTQTESYNIIKQVCIIRYIHLFLTCSNPSLYTTEYKQGVWKQLDIQGESDLHQKYICKVIGSKKKWSPGSIRQYEIILKIYKLISFTAMIIPEPTKYIVSQLQLPQSILKEVDPSRKKELNAWSDKASTIIIDYGSETIMAGYESSQNPELIFRPQISKNRDLTKSDVPVKAYINTSYDQLDFAKINYKSPYERNIILHFSLIQQCNDYIFAEIAKSNKRVRSPLIITEPVGNPIHCRTSFLEQIFECYEIDSVMVGLDALFAYFYQLDCSITRYESQTALIVNIGASTIHILAMVNGKLDPNSVCRINLGGSNAFDLFSKSILLKNPHFKEKLNYSFMRQLYEKFTSVAIDYRLQLNYFESRFKPPANNTIYRNKIHQQNKEYTEQLQFIPGIELDFDLAVEVPEQELRRKEEVRKRMSEKLKDTLNRRKEMKKKTYESELANYIDLRDRYHAHDKFAHEEVVEIFGQHRPLDKLEKKIKALQVKLGLAEQKGGESKFNLINIPDHELPPQKLKYKKLQIYQKQAIELRKQRQEEKQQEQARMRDLRQNNPELYLHQLKQSYKNLNTRIKQNERIRSQLSNRKSKLKQRKMQAIARLAEQQFDSEQEEGEDDWLVYKDLDESDHYSELGAMEAELRQIDPEWTQAKDHHHLKETNQLYIQTDLVKCHQIYFQPMMVGTNQIDIVKAIARTLDACPASVASQLRKNIIVVGGGSKIPGLAERLTRDLISESPTGSTIKIYVGKGGSEGAFLGMQYIAKYQKELLEGFSYKREEYLSKNGKYYVENPWSNPQPRM